MPHRDASVTDISLSAAETGGASGSSTAQPREKYEGNQAGVHEGGVVPGCPHRVGRMYVWCWGRNPFHKIVPCTFFTGPDFPCMCCTYSLIVVPTALFHLYVLPELHIAATIIGAISSASLLGSFTLAACSDPGVIPPRSPSLPPPKPPEGGPRMSLCTHCNVLRPPGAVHCHDCKVCVLELDHHCPWTGKCIGKRNLKFFYAFLTTLCTHLAIVVITTVVWMGQRSPRESGTTGRGG